MNETMKSEDIKKIKQMWEEIDRSDTFFGTFDFIPINKKYIND